MLRESAPSGLGDTERPSISFVIPTYNAARVLRRCLQCIREQNYDGKVEIVIADGGSTDETVAIARDFNVDKLVANPLRTGESGKMVGINASTGDLIALVDSDNFLIGSDWLSKMVAPFRNRDVVSSEALRWHYRADDGMINRYCALTGINDPLCLFIGNYDRYSYLTNRWTDCKVQITEADGYEIVRLSHNDLPTMGANGYLVRREVLQVVLHGDYYFDIDVVYNLVVAGYNTIARVDVDIEHDFCPDFRQYMRKQARRGVDYFHYKKKGMRTYPWTGRRLVGVFKFALATVLLFPILLQSAMGYMKKPDRAWFFHIPACWATLIIYVYAFISKSVRRGEFNRSQWHQ